MRNDIKIPSGLLGRTLAGITKGFLPGSRIRLPYAGPKFRNDGFDQVRIDAAKAKREDRAARNLRGR